MFGTDRTTLRRFWLTAWYKYQQQQPLEPLERQIVEALLQHPEYQPLFASEAALAQEWHPEGGQSNPFLHLSLHLAIREQVSTDRPAGITALHQQLCERHGDRHTAEHAMLECLGAMIWQAQQPGSGGSADEGRYLTCLRRLLS